MNKIEYAIDDVKGYLEHLKREELKLYAEINTTEAILQTLKSVQQNTSIPHEEY